MHKAEGVSNFVGGELAHAGKHHLQQARIGGLSLFIGREQALEDEVVLTGAQRAESDVPLDDFASTGIDDGLAVRPPTRGAMHPLDVVVADVHGIGIGGQHLDAEGVAESGRFERLVPPARTFEQRRADGFGRAGIEVIDDGLHRIAQRCVGILLLQAMANNETLLERLTDGSTVVGIG